MRWSILVFAGCVFTALFGCDPPCPGGTIPGPHGSCIDPSVDGGVRDDGSTSRLDGCVGQTNEVCGDENDEDCDGRIDEGCACTAPVPETCNARDDDCNGTPDDGSAASSCGNPAHATAGCSGGTCFAQCASGYTDCDHQFENGCEAQLDRDVNNCGTCGNACGWDCNLEMSCDDAVDFAQIGGAFCVVRESGTVVCWGNGDRGQFGDGTVGMRSEALPVPGLTDVIGISGSNTRVCALLAPTGSVRCWTQAIGPGGGSVPEDVPGLSGVTALAVKGGSRGAGHLSCAVRSGGVQCWGDGFEGQLGEGQNVVSHSLVSIDIQNVRAVALADVHVCALKENGEVWCWGGGSVGQLGHGGLTNSRTPVRAGTIVAERMAAHGTRSCAAGERDVYCWGQNFGPTPTPIALPDTSCEIRTLTVDCVACVDGRTICWDETRRSRVLEGVRDVAELIHADSGSTVLGITTSGAPITISRDGSAAETAPRPAR